MTGKKLLEYIVPWFLGACVSLGGWMGKSLYEISQNLNVVVYQIKDHNEQIREHKITLKDHEGRLHSLERRKR